MNWKNGSLFFLLNFPLAAFSAGSFYCPMHQGYINLGMSEAQVVAACGEPMSKEDSARPVMQQIPVKQLIYVDLNRGSVYPTLNPIYEAWSLPSGSKGVSLEVNIINNVVSSVQINGGSNNAMTICGGYNVAVGDDESKVTNACGTAQLINLTYINQPVPSKNPPQIWVYQVDQYQDPISLTFVNGKLQSIN